MFSAHKRKVANLNFELKIQILIQMDNYQVDIQAYHYLLFIARVAVYTKQHKISLLVSAVVLIQNLQ